MKDLDLEKIDKKLDISSEEITPDFPRHFDEFVEEMTRIGCTNFGMNMHDDHADSGIIVIYALSAKLKYGMDVYSALKSLHAKGLNNPYELHSKIITYLDMTGIDYDDDRVLDICLENFV